MYRIAACALLFAAVAAAETFENRQTKTFDFKPGQTLHFQSEFGHLEVKTGDVAKVQVEAYHRVETSSQQKAQEIFNDLALEGKPQSDGVVIEAFLKNGWEEGDDHSWRNHICMSGHRLRQTGDDGNYCLKYAEELKELKYIVTVPRKATLDLETRAGHMTIADIDGPVTARTAGGHITAGHIGGVAQISTAGGHIEVADSTGRATLKTAGGHISIGDVGGDLIAETAGGHIETGHVKGPVRAKTAGGHIQIRQADGAVEAKTVGGSINARIAAQPKDASYLETSAGSVSVELASNVKVDVDAESRGGGIQSDFDLQTTSDSDSNSYRRWNRQRSLRGKINGGGPRLEVRTTHGRISLSKASFEY